MRLGVIAFLSSNLSNDSRRNGEVAAVKFIEVACGQLARLLNDASASIDLLTC